MWPSCGAKGGAEVSETRIGNVFAHAGGDRQPHVLIVAHADELCYLVRAIHPDGFLWLANGQAWQRTTSLRNSFMVGQRVRVLRTAHVRARRDRRGDRPSR